MADFKEVLEVAQRGYHHRDDYPPYALASWDDRTRWTGYLEKINEELDTLKENACPHCGVAEGDMHNGAVHHPGGHGGVNDQDRYGDQT